MATKNVKAKDGRFVETRLAGGGGLKAANQGPEALLRRAVLACLLWEDLAYQDGVSVTQNIASLIPQVDPLKVAALAIECRVEQKLRHVPLFIVKEMCKHDSHKSLVADVLPQIIRRPDEMCEFLTLYWEKGKTPLAKQVKKGLAKSFQRFDEYQLAKWSKDSKSVKLKDVMLLVHPKPNNPDQAALWGRLLKGELATPDTWEVGMSKAKTNEEKRNVWERLMKEKKLGASALLKNLRNMESVDVKPSLIRAALAGANTDMILPMNYFSAVKYAPNYVREIESMMLQSCAQFPKLKGHTVIVVDVSGSMSASVSSKSEFNRMDAGVSMAVLAAEMSESVSIYLTAGSMSTHETKRVKPSRGFGLVETISNMGRLGGGGIFTRQCLEYINTQEKEKPDRVIVFSDSQDCDRFDRTPKPFGKYNYIVDISSHNRGINYNGVWTAEISGWSENFLKYIAAYESN